MAYSYLTRAQARTALRERLNDTSGVHWSDAELNTHIIEALRAWGSTAGAFRERGTLLAQAGVPFYDANHLVLDGIGNRLLSRDVTDRELVNSIQYHLAEIPTDFSINFSWLGTEQFVMTDVVGAIQRRRNQFLLETRQVLNESQVDTTPGVDTVPLPDKIIDVRRAAWIKVIGGIDTAINNLWKTDEFTLSSYAVGWSVTPAEPQAFTIATVLDTTLRLAPTPMSSGRLHLLGIEADQDLNLAAGTALDIQDDFTPTIKWGALGDLLTKDGPAKDEERAVYCEQRWQEGIALARLANTVLYAEVASQSAQIVSIFDLDVAFPGWQLSSGTPEVIAMAGSALIGLYKVPDIARTIVLDVVRNALVPTDDSTYLQIGREYLDIILDYAQHLAAFKEGGSEFKATMPHFDRFMRGAAKYNDKLRANAGMFASLADNVQREEEQRPLFATSAPQ